MDGIFARLGMVLGRHDPRSAATDHHDAPAACSWEAMREVYQEQAARGVPEAIAGLELIEQGRWPRSGRPRERAQGG